MWQYFPHTHTIGPGVLSVLYEYLYKPIPEKKDFCKYIKKDGKYWALS